MKKGTKKARKVAPSTAITLVNQNEMPMLQVDPQALIARAIDKNLPIESMQRLLDMRKQLRDEWAKEQYFTALSKFQKLCPEIKKTKAVFNDNGTERYRYAPLASIIKQVGDLLEECGFSYDLKPRQTVDTFTAVCVSHHRDGHSETTEFSVPLGAEKYMSEVQKVGARNTFANRYAFCNAYGIMTADEDTDSLDVGEAKGAHLTKKVEAARNVTPPKTELEVAHENLLKLYQQMTALKLFTPFELDQKKRQAQLAVTEKSLPSLLDLFNLWSQETKERQKKQDIY